MPSTTPLAPWMTFRNLLVFAILLTTAACGSKQYSSTQNLADAQNGPTADSQQASAQSQHGSPAIADSFNPTSPFLHFGGKNYCALPETVAGTKNPFDLSALPGSVNQRLVALAFSQIGTLYRPGGTEPSTGFDCSGFTTWVYSKLGVNLPRSSREQFLEGKVVAKSQLRKGDLVFFGNKRHITHVGIYLEDHKFIHSSSSGDTVKISSLDDPAWENKYTGARRVF